MITHRPIFFKVVFRFGHSNKKRGEIITRVFTVEKLPGIGLEKHYTVPAVIAVTTVATTTVTVARAGRDYARITAATIATAVAAGRNYTDIVITTTTIATRTGCYQARIPIVPIIPVTPTSTATRIIID